LGKIRNYYAGGNTSIGFYSLYDEIFGRLEHLYILKGGPGTGKSSFIRAIGSSLLEKGFDIEVYHCSSDNDSLDGIIVPKLSLGLVDGTAPHIMDPRYPGVIDHIIPLGEYWDTDKLHRNKSEIVDLTDQISEKFALTYQSFAEARKIHEEKEKIYIRAMDFKQADKIADHLIAQIFRGDIEPEHSPITMRKFFGAATPKGAVNFIENLTSDVKKRYIIKGRSGSGKSTLMRKVAAHAESLGLTVEMFLCGFDPSSIDMIILPTLGITILDGTSPHVIDPSRESDEVIDMFQLCIHPQVETDYKEEIEALEARYKAKMKEGTRFLQEAKELHDQLESYYIDATDFKSIDRRREALLKGILTIAESVSP
jgi:hypothetical protein